jgi:hypothetical protein
MWARSLTSNHKSNINVTMWVRSLTSNHKSNINDTDSQLLIPTSSVKVSRHLMKGGEGFLQVSSVPSQNEYGFHNITKQFLKNICLETFKLIMVIGA